MPNYMLKPHNYSQAMRPNLYNVNYGRVGAYKGMGGLGETTTYEGQAYEIGPDGSVYLVTGGGKIPLAGGTDPVLQQTGQIQWGTTTGQTQNWLLWIAGGFVLLLLLGRRR